MNNGKTVRVLSIDAWRNGPKGYDWTWNDWRATTREIERAGLKWEEE